MPKDNNKSWNLCSMTGSSNVNINSEAFSIDVTLRSFNSRNLDIKCRLPEELLIIEQEFHNILSHNLNRGRIELSLRIKGYKKAPNFDEEKASYLLKQMANFIEKNPMLSKKISIGDLLRYDLFVPQEDLGLCSSDLKNLAIKATKEAVLGLKAARICEAELLEPGLKESLELCRALLGNIRERQDTDVKNRYNLIISRINELFSTLSLNQDRVYQECALLAERSDFKEEIERLSAHIEHFASICQELGPKGRRLDFLCQEMLRESGTLLTKAFEHAVMTVAIELKAEIERMREQVQNLL